MQMSTSPKWATQGKNNENTYTFKGLSWAQAIQMTKFHFGEKFLWHCRYLFGSFLCADAIWWFKHRSCSKVLSRCWYWFRLFSCDRMCFFKLDFRENSFSHVGHPCFILSCTLAMCMFKPELDEKLLSHCGHLDGRCFWWTDRMWVSRFDFCEQRLSHCGQWCGFFFSCTDTMWTSKCPCREKLCWHCRQWYGFFFSDVGVPAQQHKNVYKSKNITKYNSFVNHYEQCAFWNVLSLS